MLLIYHFLIQNETAQNSVFLGCFYSYTSIHRAIWGKENGTVYRGYGKSEYSLHYFIRKINFREKERRHGGGNGKSGHDCVTLVTRKVDFRIMQCIE